MIPAAIARGGVSSVDDGTSADTAPWAVDEAAFDDAVRRHRRELHVHCYRMLASFDEAEDAVQETLLRAWRHREAVGRADPADGAGGQGRSASTEAGRFRAWLYRVATNVCLDMLRSRGRRGTEVGSMAEVPWLQPYPDRLLDEVAPADEQPEAVAVARETIELAFLAALQVLPPRQRAALILRDVLGMPAAETASLLEVSVAAANSALQRARETVRAHLPSHRLDWSSSRPSRDERVLLERFIDAHERCDAAAAIAAAAVDIRITMPPHPWCFDGVEAMAPLLDRAFGPDREGDWRLVPTRANRMPAAASYVRRPGDTAFRAFKLDVLRVEGGAIAEITTFDSALFRAFGLPPTL